MYIHIAALIYLFMERWSVKNVVHSTHFDQDGREGKTVANSIDSRINLMKREIIILISSAKLINMMYTLTKHLTSITVYPV